MRQKKCQWLKNSYIPVYRKCLLLSPRNDLSWHTFINAVLNMMRSKMNKGFPETVKWQRNAGKDHKSFNYEKNRIISSWTQVTVITLLLIKSQVTLSNHKLHAGIFQRQKYFISRREHLLKCLRVCLMLATTLSGMSVKF